MGLGFALNILPTLALPIAFWLVLLIPTMLTLDICVAVDHAGIRIRRPIGRQLVLWSSVDRVVGKEIVDRFTTRLICLELKEGTRVEGAINRWASRGVAVYLQSTVLLNKTNTNLLIERLQEIALANQVSCDLPGGYRSPFWHSSPR